MKTKEPATEGFVALLEPFIDTIVICTMTALTIVITGAWADPDASEIGGVKLTSRAFESVLPWFPVVAGRGRGDVRVLDDDQLVVLRHEGHGLPLR